MAPQKSRIQAVRVAPLCFQLPLISMSIALLTLGAWMIVDLGHSGYYWYSSNRAADQPRNKVFTVLPPILSLTFSTCTLVTLWWKRSVPPWLPLIEGTFMSIFLAAYDIAVWSAMRGFNDDRGTVFLTIYHCQLAGYLLYIVYAAIVVDENRKTKIRWRTDSEAGNYYPHSAYAIQAKLESPKSSFELQPPAAVAFPIAESVAAPPEPSSNATQNAKLSGDRRSVLTSGTHTARASTAHGEGSIRDETMTIATDLPPYASPEGSIMQVANGMNHPSYRVPVGGRQSLTKS